MCKFKSGQLYSLAVTSAHYQIIKLSHYHISTLAHSHSNGIYFFGLKQYQTGEFEPEPDGRN